jgi:hypothetical protein
LAPPPSHIQVISNAPHIAEVAAREMCFIANSVNFPIACEPTIVVAE